MARLRSLSLHFISSTANYPTLLSESRGRRAVFPVLTRLDFRGFSWYFDRLVAGIDAPCLGDIELTFLNEGLVGFPKLCEFIDRIKIHKSHRRAHILFSERAISFSLIQPGAPTRLKLEFFCEPPSEQLLFVTRVCAHLFDSLFNVEDLCISTM
ncbi:hypothetical protein EDB92DRAFT_1864350, partial [Lactarius akahatsu]